MRTASFAMMLTDIEGFTEKTSRQTRRENERMIRLHHNLLSPVLRRFRGRKVKTLGDAYLVVFDSATRAIACGAAIQDRLAKFNEKVGEEDRIRLRVAISAGELRVVGRDVFGEAVNVASRVETHTEAGEVCFTEAALLLSDHAAFQYEEIGPTRLKGIPEPVRLYRLKKRWKGGAPYGEELLSGLNLPAPDPERLARWEHLPSPRVLGASLLVVALAIAAFFFLRVLGRLVDG